MWFAVSCGGQGKKLPLPWGPPRQRELEHQGSFQGESGREYVGSYKTVFFSFRGLYIYMYIYVYCLFLIIRITIIVNIIRVFI